MKKQLLILFASILFGVIAIVFLAIGKFITAVLLFVLAVVAWKIAKVWQRKNPIPMPYYLRWAMFIPRGHSPKKLMQILKPISGERMLEVGPGPGIHALPVAAALLPGGTLDVLDIQQEMLDALKERAAKKGVTNIIATCGNAMSLPYPNETFDAAYIIGSLGEMPDAVTVLRELRRVLKRNGRLVVAEVIIDPDFVSINQLKSKAAEAGFHHNATTGPTISYFARFSLSPA